MKSYKTLHYTSRGVRVMTRVIYLVTFSLFGVLLLTYYSVYTHATTLSWEGTPKLSSKIPDVTDMQCRDRDTISIQGKAGSDQACVEVGKNMRFATLDNGEFAVSFGGDQKYYTALMPCVFVNCYYFGDLDILIAFGGPGPWYRSLNVYKDFSKNLFRRTNPDNPLITEYLPRNYEPEYTFTKSLITSSTTLEPIANGYKGFGVSDNGRWLVFEARNKGYFRLDLKNFELKRFVRFPSNHDYRPQIVQEFAVSNDGTRVLYTGENTTTSIFELSDECGDSPTDQQIYDNLPLENPCPEHHLDDFLSSQISQYRYSKLPRFIDDSGNEFTLYARANDYTKGAWLTVAAPGYNPARLDYLALGDSYSSGEGDTELTKSGQKYYLAHTDQEENISLGIPKEKCHQSTRAYPFLLADYYNISVGDKFQTVACSGATMNDISSIAAYNGQGGRLNGITGASSLQMQALDEFIPGRVRQLKFIEKYQPKAITVTIGGNDVGFGQKISACISPQSILRDCNWANEDKDKLGFQIKNQFSGLSTLFERIKLIDERAKVYVIGYPQFISDAENAKCELNAGAVSYEERQMMTQATHYMNEVIEAASKKVGVKYVDIEDSLNGGRLCDEGQEFVTGISNFGSQESYHPNSHGHWKIAQRIKSQIGAETILSYQDYPASADTSVTSPASSNFNADENSAINAAMMPNDTVRKGSPINLLFNPFTFQQNSIVHVELHSNPTDLGDFNVSNADSVDMNVTIPASIPVGYHTLIATGLSYSGEPISLSQTVLVTGQDYNDLDEDGTPDKLQACGPFTAISGIDEDYDGIDDACDPEIEYAQPYKVRNGSPAKGEKSDYMYIERNVHATDFTGVSGDLDPDKDGWAIVAQSTDTKNAGVPAHFWIDDKKIPHVSIRTDTRGCVQYTPRSLTVVKNNKIRGLKQESKNTSTCRKESPAADVDKDGTPDDQQQLYRARNGSAQAGEDPSDIYLERNSTAAEARLGISDYSHDRPWNTLASYHGAYPVQFAKLVVDSDKTSIPIVIAKQTKTNAKGKIITTCIALQSKNTHVITIKNKSRKLIKVSLPEGERCG